ncbi:dephospho-CoA kinase [Pseudoalteromonas translucida KMM 520]|uniref:Dephospho-CoA kinase n=2 Tax=Pseudoalteromonas TaxID=53246 RepID=A0A0U2WW06_9GAMM|nr:dephospho-CoA kinase [Pseudoalteromonas translucida]ALS31769.1 dephospho-CoA kinase [Pseudoalteromonas translucida KMM 520]
MSEHPVKVTNINNWVLGLTGGIGCGKTAVSNMLEALDICVIDADIIARQVVEQGSEGLKAIIAHFGADILLADGNLNRSALRELVFSNNEHKNWLNALLHPLIRQQIITDLNNATSPYVVLVAPLLFENGLDKYCNRTLLIDVPKNVQIERTVKRDNISLEQVNSIIAAQMSREQKQQQADDILNNDRSLALVKHDLIALHKGYLKLALK